MRDNLLNQEGTRPRGWMGSRWDEGTESLKAGDVLQSWWKVKIKRKKDPQEIERRRNQCILCTVELFKRRALIP